MGQPRAIAPAPTAVKIIMDGSARHGSRCAACQKVNTCADRESILIKTCPADHQAPRSRCWNCNWLSAKSSPAISALPAPVSSGTSTARQNALRGCARAICTSQSEAQGAQLSDRPRLERRRAARGALRQALYAALVDTPVSGDIPGYLLTHLPGWCVYVETPEMTAPLIGGGEIPMHGFWAWLNRWPESHADDLELMLHVDIGDELPIVRVPLIGTLEEGLCIVEREWREAIARGNAFGDIPVGFADASRRALPPLLSLLLYLCSEEPDMDAPRAPETQTNQAWMAAISPGQAARVECG